MVNPFSLHLELLRDSPDLDLIRDALRAIGSTIEKCDARIREAKASGSPEYLDFVIEVETALIEMLLGAAFVVCQTFITSVVSKIMSVHRRADAKGCRLHIGRTKAALMAADNPLSCMTRYTAVEVTDAFANYFKHCDEWGVNWSSLEGVKRRTADIVMAVGATAGSTGNLRTASEQLGNPEYRDTERFALPLANWRTMLVQQIGVELSSKQLL